MSIKHMKAFIFFVLISLGLSSCFKDPSFDFKPNISFKSIKKFNVLDQILGAKKDSIVISINFKDGDGDLGLNSEEIAKAANLQQFNYVVKPFRISKGKTTAFEPKEPYSGFFLRFKNDDKKEPLEGTLGYKIDVFTAFWPFKKDTVKYEIYIRDRAGNISNTIETTPIIINQL